MSYQETRIWRRAFEPANNDTEKARSGRERLRYAYVRMREKVIPLLNDIGRWLPEFTVHDITHIDALWECADSIAGTHYALTPTEAFVLGGSFLYHDAGMTLAAYDTSEEMLRSSNFALWTTVVTQKLRSAGFEEPNDELLSNPPDEIRQDAIHELLRLLHAEQAQHLPKSALTSKDGPLWLIEDAEVREEFAAAIGAVAASHHWSVDLVERRFVEGIRGAPSFCPPEWEYDLLKVACLLRVADASHIDSRRAPSFLAAIRRPKDLSRLHWLFQRRLSRVRFDSNFNALVYNSREPFKPTEAEAWWLAFDVVQMIDGELRAVDALLGSRRGGTIRFAARSVRNAGSPAQFAERIEVEGWTPVDARVRIGNVTEVIRRFGGEQLYGLHPEVAIRELLQNAFDAVLARRADQGLPEDSGRVDIAMEKLDDGSWRLSVADDGIGMDQGVITQFLLDFGSSLWHSPKLSILYPKLVSSNFEPTGKYGIGFFSVFMLGDVVNVTSKPYDQGVDRTCVLEFGNGLETRPIIRDAERQELPPNMNTNVAVVLKPGAVAWLLEHNRAAEREGLPPDVVTKEAPVARLLGDERNDYSETDSSMVDAIMRISVRLCVAAPATVNFRSPANSILLCRANDWTTIEPTQLTARLRRRLPTEMNDPPYGAPPFSLRVESWYQHLLPVYRVGTNGKKFGPVGRLGIVPYLWEGQRMPYRVDRSDLDYIIHTFAFYDTTYGHIRGRSGAILAGTFPAANLRHFFGIIKGESRRLSRDDVRIDADRIDMDDWTTNTAIRITEWIRETFVASEAEGLELMLSNQLLLLGGRPRDLKLFVMHGYAHNVQQMSKKLRRFKRFTFWRTRTLLHYIGISYGMKQAGLQITAKLWKKVRTGSDVLGWDLGNEDFQDRDVFHNLKSTDSAVLLREAVDQAWGADSWTETASPDGTLTFLRIER